MSITRQTSFRRPMDVYMKSGLHIDVHWASKGLLIPTGSSYVVWCLKKLEDFIFKFPINGSFFWGKQNHQIYYIQQWWRVTEFVVNWTNYQGCQFAVHFIHCETSREIFGIVNEFVQNVQNYFRYVYTPI